MVNGSEQSHNEWIISFHCVCNRSDKEDTGFLSGVVFVWYSDRDVNVKRCERGGGLWGGVTCVLSCTEHQLTSWLEGS